MAHRAGCLSMLLTAAVVLLALAPRGAAYPWQVCGTTGNFTANSTYQANLDAVAAALPRNISSSPDLFATAMVGAVPEQVSALALCRGDANATECSGCLATAFQDVQNMCAYDKDAAIYYDPCILYYSNVPFLSSVDNAASTSRVNLQNVTSDPGRFNGMVAALVNATADYAAHNSTRRYASGEAVLDRESEFPKVYSWAQCTPDLTPAQCGDCLAAIIAKLPRLFTNRIGGRVLGVRCSYRYEVNPFLNGLVMVHLTAPPIPTASPPAAAAAAAGEGKDYNVPRLVLAILLPTIAALVLINILVWLCFWRRMERLRSGATQPYSSNSAESENISSVESMLIDISTLRAATGCFAERNKLGEGGFGAVYKGTLPDGDEIAVKRLSKSSAQGVGELKNELALVAKLQHKNLVRLVGVCLEQEERLLVYEFVPNRSLDQILFDADKRQQLDWGKRYKIINGIARGLQYLHEDSQLKVVHRDLKASNILLDMNMNPKISDFGLARLFGRDQTQGVTNLVIGTYGYMSPEYAMRGNYSLKSDVFSFGVMVLEIVTGKKNNDCYNSLQSEDLLTLVWEQWTARAVSEAVDPVMGGGFSWSDVMRCIHIGLLCVQENPADRPVMSSVVMMLGSDTVSLRAPSKPAFCASSGGTSSGTSTAASVQGK
ncbi:Os07g0537500 [Oryza sativa Japonica Group]|uniref:Os07g0537500 protein n=2 Tax=Oryza sativa subsp. japonica TaxID=39947 RepID=Q0D5T4_ORYSJ|nr:Os07g0537500 [Oryza sativa Japonica Group]BAT01931.1 Os07g0537500 [Oryza sativa Japonica Group]|eukprot:NP_001059875.1 Os07g0537500 [Oryza sativa Japonica Group]